jgi:Ca2+-binding RTX toxin-like protein
VTGASIKVIGGNAGNMVNAAALTGANRVVAVGGAGADTFVVAHNAALTGGGGADVFEFTTPGSATTPNADTIADFTTGTDRIAFSNTGFSLGLAGASATPHALPTGLFSTQTNGAFDNSAERFAYNAAAGALYYDARGNTAGSSRELVATLTNHPALAGTDLFYVS